MFSSKFKEVIVETVTVYYFESFDIIKGEMVRSRRPATLEAIAMIDNAVVLKETAQEVDTSLLDGNGFYDS
jgi:hypothetical protein